MGILLSKTFEKNFKKLPSKVKIQFYARARLFIGNRLNSVLNNHSVDPTYPNCRSINITGDYRVIYKDTGNDTLFMRIGTHSELY